MEVNHEAHGFKATLRRVLEELQGRHDYAREAGRSEAIPYRPRWLDKLALTVRDAVGHEPSAN